MNAGARGARREVGGVAARPRRAARPIPAGPNESDVIATLKPRDEWPNGWTQDTIADAMREKLSRFPGVQIVMAQPISDRVDEMVTGVRSDVAVKIFGDDMEMLRDKAGEIAAVAAGIAGLRDHARRTRRRPAVPDDRRSTGRPSRAHGLNVVGRARP